LARNLDSNAYFEQHKSYPTTVADISHSKSPWPYLNPFDKQKTDQTENQPKEGKGIKPPRQKEAPQLFVESFGSETDDVATDKLRPRFYIDLGSGEFWKDKRKLHPGEIACCNAQFKSSRGNINSFVITVAGRDGEPLRVGDAQTAYFIASEDGRPRKRDTINLKTPSAVWILVKPMDPGMQFWLKETASIVFLLAAVLCLSIWLSCSKKDPTKGLWMFGTAVCAVLSALYFGVSHFR
jgi:hypothetical protein